MSPSGRHGKNSTIFASFDVETDGNNPMKHSMRSIGVALFREGNSRPFDTFYITLKPQADSDVEKSCYDNFWKYHVMKWRDINDNPSEITDAMAKLSEWLKTYSASAIRWVSNPANFDWMFLKCYYEQYGPADKFEIGFFCHDLGSLLRCYSLVHDIRDRRGFSRSLAQGFQYTHNALDDAVHQGVIYMNLRRLINEKRLLNRSVGIPPHHDTGNATIV
jgi:hypothetical protein